MTSRFRHPISPIAQKLLLSAAAIGSVVFIGFIDSTVNPDIIHNLFYLLPIGWVSWHVNRRAGWLLALLSAILASASTEFVNGVLLTSPLLGVWIFLSRLAFYLLTCFILSRLRETLTRSKELSLTDDLTQALNTRAFFDLLEKELKRSRRYERPLTVVYLDLDSFKIVNDTLGHQIGNAVLQTVVRVMQQSVRELDSVARLGGDEFAILLPETGAESAQALFPRIQESLKAAMQKESWPITFSVGVLTCARAMCNSDEVFREADRLMYSVKHAGRNGIRYETLAE